MTSSQDPALALHTKSKKIQKSKASQANRSSCYLTVQSSLKKYILLELKKAMLQFCKLNINEQDLTEQHFFLLLEKINLDDYNEILKKILKKYVKKFSLIFLLIFKGSKVPTNRTKINTMEKENKELGS